MSLRHLFKLIDLTKNLIDTDRDILPVPRFPQSLNVRKYAIFAFKNYIQTLFHKGFSGRDDASSVLV